ncbi:DNA-directed RNA polymerase subunit L [Candidatus Bathyarchaeota archaeon]|nr:DNA-directed RNA polymerase subunit L [Candidatus Bathyarchaeota archaeon]
MKAKILKRTPNELKLEVNGIDHTFCNLLQKRLSEDENVDLAGYDIPHPLASNSIIYVRTKGTVNPEEALREAVKRTRKINREFSKELKKALKT